MDMSFLSEMMKTFHNWILVMAAQVCEYTKNHLIVKKKTETKPKSINISGVVSSHPHLPVIQLPGLEAKTHLSIFPEIFYALISICIHTLSLLKHTHTHEGVIDTVLHLLSCTLQVSFLCDGRGRASRQREPQNNVACSQVQDLLRLEQSLCVCVGGVVGEGLGV